MRLFIINLFLVFLTHAAFAQTREISHKSHSGNKETFNQAADLDPSDFGLPPAYRNLAIRELRFINDTMAVISPKCTLQAGRYHYPDTLYIHPRIAARRDKQVMTEWVRESLGPTMLLVDTIHTIIYPSTRVKKLTLAPVLIDPGDNNRQLLLVIALVSILAGFVHRLVTPRVTAGAGS